MTQIAVHLFFAAAATSALIVGGTYLLARKATR